MQFETLWKFETQQKQHDGWHLKANKDLEFSISVKAQYFFIQSSTLSLDYMLYDPVGGRQEK